MYHKCTVSYNHTTNALKLIDVETQYETKAETKQLTRFTHQAGGHSRIFNVGDQKIAKPCNPQEAYFYQHIHSEPLLEPLVPKYWENRLIETLNDDYRRSFQTPGEFIILENLTTGFHHPCIMDIKLGNINYDPQRHLLDKIRVRKVKLGATTAGKLGVRISALRVFRPQHGNYLVRSSKTFHHIHTEKQLKSALKLYLHDGYRLRTELIPMFIKKLKQLQKALKAQTTFEFLSSSVLFIYDGDLENVKASKPVTKSQGVVRLIDFDHATIKPRKPEDSNGVIVDPNGVILGINTLINILEKIFSSAKKTKTDLELIENSYQDSRKKTPKRSSRSQE